MKKKTKRHIPFDKVLSGYAQKVRKNRGALILSFMVPAIVLGIGVAGALYYHDQRVNAQGFGGGGPGGGGDDVLDCERINSPETDEDECCLEGEWPCRLNTHAQVLPEGSTTIFPGEDYYFGAYLWATEWFGPGFDNSDRRYVRTTMVPDAMSNGDPRENPRDLATMYNSGIISQLAWHSHLDETKAEVPLRFRERFHLKFDYRAGANDSSGTEPKKNWDFDGGWNKGGIFKVSFGSRVGDSPSEAFYLDHNVSALRQDTTFEQDDPDTVVHDNCYEGTGGRWCTWDSRTIRTSTGEFVYPFGIEVQPPKYGNPDVTDLQQIFWQAGEVDFGWFVGELHLDKMELVKVDDRGIPTSNENLILNPDLDMPPADYNGWGGRSNLKPDEDFFEESIESEGGNNSNNYYNFWSKNYYVYDASVEDTIAYDYLRNNSYNWQKRCAKSPDNHDQDRFYFLQGLRSGGSTACFSDDSDKLTPGTAIHDARMQNAADNGAVPWYGQNNLLKMHINENVCEEYSDLIGDVEPGKIAYNFYIRHNAYRDCEGVACWGDEVFTGYNNPDWVIEGLPDTPSADPTVRTPKATQNAHIRTVYIQCSTVGVHINSKVPTTGNCTKDSSEYTASTNVDLVLTGADIYSRIAVADNPTDFATYPDTKWVPIDGTCSSNKQFSTSLFGAGDVGIQDKEPGVKTVYVQLKDDNGHRSAIVSDDIEYGYPRLSAYRGDVFASGFSNSDFLGKIFGEGSFIPIGGDSHSRYTCNPDDGMTNTDYMVAVGGNSLTKGTNQRVPINIGAPCGYDYTFQSKTGGPSGTTNSKWYKNDAPAEDITTAIKGIADGLKAAKTIKCTSTTIVSDNNLNYPDSMSNCSVVSGRDADEAEIVHVQGHLNFDTSDTILDDKTGDESGTMIFVVDGDVNIKKGIGYKDTITQISKTKNLANLSIIAGGKINVRYNVKSIVGVYVTPDTFVTTTAFSSSAQRNNKLSLYGSIIAKSIDLGRNHIFR